MKLVFILILISGIIFPSYAQKSNNRSSKKVLQELVGTWTLISVDNIYPDSTRLHPYGDNPQGMLIFDENGNYAIQILKSIRPHIASGDKNKCTPEENAMMVQGSNSHFGKYSVEEANKTITFNIAHASFPNWEGTT